MKLTYLLRLLVSIFLVASFLYSQEFKKNEEPTQSGYIFGFNFSKLYSTENDGKIGFYIGANKIKTLNQNWIFKYGFSINSKQSKQSNKSILYGSGMAGDYDSFSKGDINLRFIFLDLKLRFDRKLISKHQFELYSIFGSSFNIYMFHIKDITEYERIDTEEKLKSDYHSYTRVIPFPILDKMGNYGFSTELGIGVRNKIFSFNAIYEIDLFDIDNVGNLRWEEKYHQLNIIFGIPVN